MFKLLKIKRDWYFIPKKNSIFWSKLIIPLDQSLIHISPMDFD
jgi:hypothetical protein